MKKTLSLLLALAMVLTLFAGVAQASANVSIGSSVATVLPDGARTPGRIDIASAAQPAVAAGDRTVVRVTLPAGVTWVDPAAGGFVTPNTAVTRADDNRTATFTVTTATGLIRFSGLQVNVPAAFRGDLNADVVVTGQTATGDFVWEQRATVRIANVLAGGTSATALATLPVLKGVANQPVGGIRIVEAIAGSLTEGGNITLTAPAGVTFAAPVAGSSFTVPVPVVAGITTIDITGISINVALTVADGPVNIAISGAGATTASVTVATVGVAGVVTPSSITAAADLATINAGRLAESVSSIRLTENMVNAFGGNRVLTLALPAGFTWNTVPTPAWAVAAPAVSADGRTLTFWTIADPTPTGGNQFDLTGLTVNTHITASAGPIVVSVGGNTGATGTVTVANLRRPVTVVAATSPNVRADSLGQSLGNLVITEVAAGALLAEPLTITLPAGTTIIGTPSVAVADVTGTEPTVAFVAPVPGAPANVITLTVTAAVGPTNPTTVTVSGIRINLDRVPVGSPITATVAGDAILEVGADAGLAGTDVGAARGTVVAEVSLGNVISRTARRTVFTIDATNFTVDGVTQPALDVAPVIQAGRTMMPIRAAANAAGVTNDNILFDEGQITIIRGDRIAQFTLGSRVMVVNGVAMNMDVAPVVVAGRALIPVRWVGTALGVPVVWDATARTVTVSVQ